MVPGGNLPGGSLRRSRCCHGVTAVFEGFAAGAVDFAFGIREFLFRVGLARFADSLPVDPVAVIADRALPFAELFVDADTGANATFGEVAVGEHVATDDDRVPLGLRSGGRGQRESEAGRGDEGDECWADLGAEHLMPPWRVGW